MTEDGSTRPQGGRGARKRFVYIPDWLDGHINEVFEAEAQVFHNRLVRIARAGKRLTPSQTLLCQDATRLFVEAVQSCSGKVQSRNRRGSPVSILHYWLPLMAYLTAQGYSVTQAGTAMLKLSGLCYPPDTLRRVFNRSRSRVQKRTNQSASAILDNAPQRFGAAYKELIQSELCP